jgi:hypothetical protein
MPRRNPKRSILNNRISLYEVYPCGNKRRFLNEYDATEAAEYQMLVKPTLQLSVYQCDLCHKWHLTRRLDNTI